MAQLKTCPYCGGKHRKKTAWLKCARRHDKSLQSWGRVPKGA